MPLVEDTGAAPLSNGGWERFAQGLADGLKVVDAYVRAGYGGASRNAARANASALAKDPRITARVEYLRAEIAATHLQRRARVVEELERVAYADPRQVLDWGPQGVTLKASEGLTDEAASAVQSVKETKDGVQITLHPKVPALAKLAEIYRLAEGPSQQTNVIVVAPEKSPSVAEWLETYGPGAPGREAE
jgi:phage terminase small subunit